MLKRTASVISAPLSLAMAFAIALFVACSEDSNNSPGEDPSSSSAFTPPPGSSAVINTNVVAAFNYSITEISGSKHENLTATVTYSAETENPDLKNGLDSVVIRVDGATKEKRTNTPNGKLEKAFNFGDNEYCDDNTHYVCAYAYFKGKEEAYDCKSFTRGLSFCRPPSSSSTTPSSSSQVVSKPFTLCIETELNSSKAPRGVNLSSCTAVEDQTSADVWLTTAGTLQVKEGAAIAEIIGKTSGDIPSPTNTNQFPLPTKNYDWLSETDYTIYGTDGQYSAIRLSQTTEWSSSVYLILPVEDLCGSWTVSLGGCSGQQNKIGKVKIWKVN